MESKRQKKFSQLILEEMVSIFTKEAKDIIGNAFITLTDVKVTPDLGSARIYISLQFIENREEVLKALNDNQAFFRGILGNRIKKVVRRVPGLIFFEDNSLDEANKINRLLDDLDKSKDTTE